MYTYVKYTAAVHFVRKVQLKVQLSLYMPKRQVMGTDRFGYTHFATKQ